MKRALQDHDKREAIVKEKPKITKREAEQRMREWKRQREGKQKGGKSGDWKKAERKRWLSRVCSSLNEYGRAAAAVMRDKEAMNALRAVVEPELLPDMRENIGGLLALVEFLEHPDDDIEKAPQPDRKEAEREGLAA